MKIANIFSDIKVRNSMPTTVKSVSVIIKYYAGIICNWFLPHTYVQERLSAVLRMEEFLDDVHNKVFKTINVTEQIT